MEWHKIISREYSALYCEMALNAIGKKANRLLNFYMKKVLIFTENKNQSFFFEKKEEKKFIKSIISQFSDNKNRFSYFKEIFNKFGEDYLLFCKKINNISLVTKTNIELKNYFLEYQKKVTNYTCIGIWVGYLLNEYWTQQGNKILKIRDDKIKEALFRPIKKSTILIIQEKVNKAKNNIGKLRKLWQEYQWLPCLDIYNKPWAWQDFKNYARNVDHKPDCQKISFEVAVKLAKLDYQQIEKFKMIKELGYIKDARDDFRRTGVFYVRKLFQEIAKRTKLNLDKVVYLTEEEIVQLLKGGQIDFDKISRRGKRFMIFIKNDKVICVDHNINKELDRLGFKVEKQKEKTIRGFSACSGEAKGIVKIIRTVHDLLKVNKGDILVAVTTHPDYVPAMQKAAAIVTDEGGLLSHAAIVSRELKIPCVVGTKIATQVLKDGDLVEVDANRGIVREIK